MSEARLALARLAAANPVQDRTVEAIADRNWQQDVLAQAATTAQLPTSARPRTKRPSRLILAAVIVIALVSAPAYAIGRSVADWLSAEPAPHAVVDDFGNYRPQLGFNPEPGKAVLVAQDDDVRLFATTNTQGTYCFIVSTRADGGTCVSKEVSSAPIVAGYVSNVPRGSDGERLLVVVGRVKDSDARTVRFAAPGGDRVTRPTGAGGFFVAGIRVEETKSACERGDWAPSFAFYNATGAVIAEQTITLAVGSGPDSARVCQSGFFMPPRD